MTKVVHISRADVGGAGGCALKICAAVDGSLTDVESRMLVFRRRSDSPLVTQYSPFKYRLERLRLELGLRTRDERQLRRIRRETGAVCTLPKTRFDICSHPLVRGADIVHLHWANDFLDYPSFFANVGKPVVWTMHDSQLFHGISHLPHEGVAATELSRRMAELKRSALERCDNLSIVFLSDEMRVSFGSHDIIASARQAVIPNMVDIAVFDRRPDTGLRRSLGLHADEYVIVFVATDIAEPNKGLDRLLQAVRLSGLQAVRVVAVGGGADKVRDPLLLTTGPIYDPAVLSQVYSAADLFVLASRHEAFAQTPLEAMACGLPVVMTPVSGSATAVNGLNGVRADDYTPEALAAAIVRARGTRYDAAAIRADVELRFSPASIAGRYGEIYSAALDRHV